MAFEQLRKVATGRISGFECENIIMTLPKTDRVIDDLRRTMREVVDERDLPLKPVFSRGTEMRSRLARWLLFLKSDCDYSWPDEQLPSGVLDFYKPTFLERITGAGQRMQQRITQFMQAGEYSYWPFTTKQQFDQTEAVLKRKGLCIGVRQASEPPILHPAKPPTHRAGA